MGKQFIKSSHCWFRPTADFRRWVVFRFLSPFLVLVFKVLVPYLFDVIRHSPYLEEEDDLQYSEY